MKTSAIVMLVAAGCFALSSLIAAQGRGQGPSGGRGPQIARGGGSGGSNVGGRGSTRGNQGANRGNPGGRRGNAGNPPGNTGEGRGNAGGVGRGNRDEGRGNAGGNGGEGRGNAGRGNAGNDDENDGGRGRGRGGRGNGDSYVDRMNPNLRARLEAMLPSGMSLEDAADGFRNQGQFIAALQQSQNHDISFADLKAEMTGDDALSLGQAMRKLGVETDED
ncbi:MAG: hypothetical protein ABW292_23430 [Vicinamibacterales bacterium]